MTLKEKFEPYVIRYTQDDVVGYLPEETPILEYQEQCEKIVEEFAIEFAEFCSKYNDKNRNVYREILHAKSKYYDTYTTKQLLEIYKKEKGL